MTAQIAIQNAVDAGLVLSLSGEKIKIRAAGPPSDRILHELIRFKPQVIEYLKSTGLRQCWTVELDTGQRFYQIKPVGVTKERAQEIANRKWPNAIVK